MERRLLVKLSISQLLNDLLTFYGIQRFSNVFKTYLERFLPWGRTILYYGPTYIFFFTVGSFFLACPARSHMYFCSPQLATCPAHLHILGFIITMTNYPARMNFLWTIPLLSRKTMSMLLTLLHLSHQFRTGLLWTFRLRNFRTYIYKNDALGFLV
jgi:hypothetical protein